ncbi:VOC family protein [Rhodanobacter sp. MP7CTX1]|uniref:VOC family protein n=1 Tax=Rhodanobacter sp. MP7CTX1 TaxID=2723084 RepID=UPI00160DA86F|nr:VOC family protein [Rhodanobacter sp. MP7CTX1]MBB6187337.1 putative glyoxalase superfamily protein PhnB [Rhodanobacter sp. MP7CTX1]
MRSNRSMPSSTIIPVLRYPDVPQAVAWLCRSFGFTERLRIGGHRVQLDVGDGAVVVTGDAPGDTPLTTHSIMVRVADVEAHYARAQATGASIPGPPITQPYGERQYSVTDIGGHLWTFSQTVDDVDPADWGGEWVAP